MTWSTFLFYCFVVVFFYLTIGSIVTCGVRQMWPNAFRHFRDRGDVVFLLALWPFIATVAAAASLVWLITWPWTTLLLKFCPDPEKGEREELERREAQRLRDWEEICKKYADLENDAEVQSTGDGTSSSEGHSNLEGPGHNGVEGGV